jgi:NAD(P)-dependent dehydrogenase (short-subunit alcohol dehydrogenase family)
MNLASLRGKVAVITGASRGIGRATALAFAEAGCHLALISRSPQTTEVADEIAGRFGVSVLFQACDVRDDSTVQGYFEKVRERLGRVDVLFNNAGMAHPEATVEKLTAEQWREVMDTNTTGIFLPTKYALPLMTRGAAIINNLSVSAKGMFPGMSAYNASKWAALGFTNTLREEVRKRGIRVIALMPGATKTEIWNQFWPDAPRDKMMLPETIAQAVVFAAAAPEEASVDEITIAPTGGAL